MSNALIVKPVEFASVTASGSASGHDPAYVGNDHMGVVWQSPGGGASASVTVDLGRDVLCDTAFLFGCDGATGAMTLKVDANTSAHGSSFTSPSWTGSALPFLAGSEMPGNGRGVALWQAPPSPPPAARYWRFTIGGLAGAPAVVARIALGRDLALERNFGFGPAGGVKDLGSVDWSRLGVLLRKRGKKLRTLSVTYKSLYRDEVEAKWLPMIEEIGNTEMLAILTDPAAGAMRQRRFYFGPCFGDMSTIWARADGFSAGLNLVSVI